MNEGCPYEFLKTVLFIITQLLMYFFILIQ